jgi:hypothetical protein
MARVSLLAAGLVVALVGCGGVNSTNTSTNTTSPTNTARKTILIVAHDRTSGDLQEGKLKELVLDAKEGQKLEVTQMTSFLKDQKAVDPPAGFPARQYYEFRFDYQPAKNVTHQATFYGPEDFPKGTRFGNPHFLGYVFVDYTKQPHPKKGDDPPQKGHIIGGSVFEVTVTAP